MDEKYLILDEKQRPVARALLRGRADASSNKEFELLEDSEPDLTTYELLDFISMTTESNAWRGKVTDQRGKRLTFRMYEPLSDDMRRNLRINLRFESYMYPLVHNRFGQYPIISQDISSGGIAFFCANELTPGEEYQLLIPIIQPPLLLPIRVLRHRPSASPIKLYSCAFADLLPEEEALLREAVFNYHLMEHGLNQKKEK